MSPSKTKAATRLVAARMDSNQLKDFGSLLQIVQMKLLRRARKAAPIAGRKYDSA
jgi:hypothetical protein